MISIIICSRNRALFNQVKESITETIGAQHEIIRINNEYNSYTLAQAYNNGVQIAKYPIVCFLHEDVLFRSTSWGSSVLRHFSNESVDVIGVAGSIYYPKCPGAWHNSQSNTRQCFFNSGRLFLNNPNNQILSEVVSLDGMFFCCKRRVLDQVLFDEQLANFHFYDLDFVFNARKKGFKAYVVYDLQIEHFSWGKFNLDWTEGAVRFYNKWKSELPMTTTPMPRRKRNSIQKDKFSEFLNIFCNYAKGDKKFLLTIIAENLKYVGKPRLWYIVVKYLLFGNPKTMESKRIFRWHQR